MTATAVLPAPRPSPEALSAGPPPSRAVASERVLHQLVRRELRLLADLSTWAAADDVPRAAALTRHAGLVGRVLLHHHAVERDRLWPALVREAAGTRAAAVLPAALERWTADCARVDRMLRDAGTAGRQWTVAGTPPARDAFAAACRALAAAVEVQTAEEERVLLPLVAAHLSPATWAGIARSCGAGLSARERSFVLGLALEDACAADRERLLSGLPRGTRAAWRVVGRGRYRAAVVRLRGEPPAG
jgi:hypothetical protein